LTRIADCKTDSMPRHIVTLSPKRALRGNSEVKARIVNELAARYRPRYSNPERPDRGSIELDFSTRTNLRNARAEVAAVLDTIEPAWRHLYDLYPTEDALRAKRF
jgi:hypothetical protein